MKEKTLYSTHLVFTLRNTKTGYTMLLREYEEYSYMYIIVKGSFLFKIEDKIAIKLNNRHYEEIIADFDKKIKELENAIQNYEQKIKDYKEIKIISSIGALKELTCLIDECREDIKSLSTDLEGYRRAKTEFICLSECKSFNNNTLETINEVCFGIDAYPHKDKLSNVL